MKLQCKTGRVYFSFFVVMWSLLLSLHGAHAATPVLTVNNDVVSLRMNAPFTIGNAEICRQFSSDQLMQLSLRINGILTPLKANDCNGIVNNEQRTGLIYFLPSLDTPDMAHVRESLSGFPWRDARLHFQREVMYAVSFNDGHSEQTLAVGTMRYQMFETSNVILGFIFVAIVTVLLLRLGRFSALLRDAPSGNSAIPVGSRSFSMARVQMAWWFFIVLISYVWLWIVVQGIPAMSVNALGLMGIGSATYLMAAGVDASKQVDVCQSQGLWRDILSDAHGLTLYRFQLLVFNVLFGLLFLVYVVQHVTMPEFDTNILALLGISAGTYAGFKIPEKQSQSTPGTDAAASGQS